MAKKKSSAGKQTRVLVVDDHPIVRQGMIRLINEAPDLAVVAEGGSAEEALQAIAEHKPDIAIIDLFLKDSSGLDLIKDIKTHHPETYILVLSMHDASVYAERVLRAGARGYIMKDEGAAKVLEGIRHVLAGEIYLGEETSQKILSRLAGQSLSSEEAQINSLTDREIEILDLLGRGLGTQEIAAKLHRSAKTVETHRENIKAKLNMASSRDLLQYAIEWSKSKRI